MYLDIFHKNNNNTVVREVVRIRNEEVDSICCCCLRASSRSNSESVYYGAAVDCMRYRSMLGRSMHIYSRHNSLSSWHHIRKEKMRLPHVKGRCKRATAAAAAAARAIHLDDDGDDVPDVRRSATRRKEKELI